MAEIVVNYLLSKLTNFLDSGRQFLRDVEDEATSLRRQLERITVFLRVADSLEESDDEVKVWVKQIREIAYDTEDALDLLKLLSVSVHDHEIGFVSLLCKMSCCVKNMKVRYRIASEMRSNYYGIQSLYDGHSRLQDKFDRAEQGQSSNKQDNTWQDHRSTALLLDKTELVGIEEPKKQITGWLVEGASRQEVISVVGMGGLGKTTLVKQVYEDPEVKKHFKACVWVTLSQYLKIEELLQEILQQIMRATQEPAPFPEDTMNRFCLKMTIKDLLQGMGYLIVLDDAWHLHEWDAIRYAFPNNTYGSRIIITTRNADLAYTSCYGFQGKVHKMKPLPSEQSWKLFCAKTFQGNPCPYHLEETCRSIIRKCGGLPLAIVAVSGVLATKNDQRANEWDVVQRGLSAEIDCNNKLKILKSVLSLSFTDLPYYLKSCFLHLSLFPEGHLINCSRLFRQWVAEGFVKEREGKTLEEVAEDYLLELLNRSLIEVARKTSDGRVHTCRIHGILRNIVVSKSRNQGYAEMGKDEIHIWPNRVRHLSLQKALPAVQEERSLSRLRTLYMFGVDRSSANIVLATEMKLLNVLDWQAAPLTRFPAQVGDWSYLRYLSFRYTKVKTIPKTVGKLQYLETLDLKHTNVTELPVEILKLRRLRHLLVYNYKNLSYSWFKYGFRVLGQIGVLQSLQKLCYIEAGDEGNQTLMKELGKLTELNRLAILKLSENDGKDLCLSIAKLVKLRALSITSVDKDEIIDIQHLSSPPPFLQRVYLTGRLVALPPWLCSLNGLTRMNLRWSRLKEDPLVCLQNLPNLVHLELLQVYEGITLYFHAEGFKNLRILGLDLFDKLIHIEVEKGAMPHLQKLIIQRCKVLKKLPSGIEHLQKLKVLDFFDMPEELVEELMSARQDDYSNVAHVPEVYYGFWRDGGWDVRSIEGWSTERDTHRGTSTRICTFPLWMRSSEFPPCWKQVYHAL